MRIIYLILIFNFGYSQVIEKQNNKFYLKSNRCEAIQDNLDALSAWTKSTNQDCNYKKEERSDSDNSCSIDITECIPKHVKKYHHTNPEIGGPNCWNLAMVMSGILPNLRYSKPEEMAFFMDAPLCKPLEKEEKKKPGDIGAIRQLNRKDFHGFIHISEDLVYSKNGFAKEKSYKFQSYKDMLNDMFIDSKESSKLKENLSSKCRGNKSINDLSCLAHVEYFRCISMDNYLEENKKNISDEVINTLSTVNQIECNISLGHFDKDQANSTLDLAYNVTEILFSYFSFEFEKIKDLTEQERFVLGTLKIRLDSLRHNLDRKEYEDNLDNRSSQKLSFLKLMLKQSIQKLESKD